MIDMFAKRALLLISLLMICGAAVYKAYALDWIGVLAAAALAAALFICLLLATDKEAEQHHNGFDSSQKKLAKTDYALYALFVISFTAAIYLIINGITNESVISPWKEVSHWVFAAYAACGFALLALAWRDSAQFLNVLLMAFSLVSFSVAVIVYGIGFGFDPFVHEATLKLIDKTGLVEPVPWYYIGQYALIIIVHKIFFLPIAWLNAWLVPLLSALFLPVALFAAARSVFGAKARTAIIPIFLLVFPYTFFIMTTPQNLAYLLLFLAVVYGIRCKCVRDLILIYALALAALSCQPIAGLPALFFAVGLTVYHSDLASRLKGALYGFIWLASAFSLPAAFYITEKSLTSAGLSDAGLINIPAFLKSLSLPIIPTGEQSLLGLVYLYGFNTKYVVALLIIIGLALAIKHKHGIRGLPMNALAGSSLIAAYAATKMLPFSFLIQYERSNYSDRILVASALLLAPFILIVFYEFLSRLKQKDRLIQYIFIIFLACWLGASLYLSYPRQDAYFNSHFYSVGKYDMAAVEWIDENSPDDYIVLANQQVSAAALRIHGFEKYFAPKCDKWEPESNILEKCPAKDLYYYPIPTGGALYQYYLDMIYNYPKNRTAKEAMRLTGTDRLYLVVNSYWWAADKIIEEAKIESQDWREFGDRVYVFQYTR